MPLVPMLAGGCNKSGDLDCSEATRVFLIPDLKPGTAAGLFDVEQPGHEVKLEALEEFPDTFVLRGDSHRGNIYWTVFGHTARFTRVVYLPAEGLLRNEDHPEELIAFKVFHGERPARVRFEFASRTCPDMDSPRPYCDAEGDLRPFIAEMTCVHRRVDLIDDD